MILCCIIIHPICFIQFAKLVGLLASLADLLIVVFNRHVNYHIVLISTIYTLKLTSHHFNNLNISHQLSLSSAIYLAFYCKSSTPSSAISTGVT